MQVSEYRHILSKPVKEALLPPFFMVLRGIVGQCIESKGLFRFEIESACCVEVQPAVRYAVGEQCPHGVEEGSSPLTRAVNRSQKL